MAWTSTNVTMLIPMRTGTSCSGRCRTKAKRCMTRVRLRSHGAGEGALARQADAEDGALGGLALDPDATTMVIDDHAADGKPETGALRLGRQRIANLAEGLEDGLVMLGRDPRAVVGDGERDIFGVAGDREGDASLGSRTEFHGVRQQVDGDLHEAVAIGQ